jgi:hypothetical protein
MWNNKVYLELTINESEKEFFCCNSLKLRIMLYKNMAVFAPSPGRKVVQNLLACNYGLVSEY